MFRKGDLFNKQKPLSKANNIYAPCADIFFYFCHLRKNVQTFAKEDGKIA